MGKSYNSHHLAGRLDERVILTMLGVALLAMIIMAARYKSHEVCVPFYIKTVAQHYNAGEVIRFETNASGKHFFWDFGDGQVNDTKGFTVVHAFDEPGEYTVALTTQANCTEYKTVMIAPAPKTADPALVPEFICPQSAEVGKPVQFQDTTRGATRWEWRFGETATVDATYRVATYTYTTPGLKTVSIVINNNEQRMGICKIYVNPAAPPPVKSESKSGGSGGARGIVVIPEKPTNDPLGGGTTAEPLPTAPPPPVIVRAPDITSKEFENGLRAVVNNFKNAQSFSAYLCGNLNLQVSFNGAAVSFTEMCNRLSAIKNEKKIKRLNVQLIKNEQTNCIIAMVVDFKEKEGFLSKIF